MSGSLSRLRAVLLGLAVLAATGLIAGGMFAVGSRSWYGRDAVRLRAGFKNIRGVEVGTVVRVQGINAGEVVRIEPPERPGGQVILHLTLRPEYRRLVTSASTVQIVSEGMIGGKALEIQPGPEGVAAEPVADDALLAAAPTAELDDLIASADGAVRETTALVRDARAGKGTLGKLVHDTDLYDEAVGTVRDARQAVLALRRSVKQFEETAESVQQVAEATDRLPLVGGYVENPAALLIRPRSTSERRVFAESALFEPGHAVLTDAGKAALDEIVPWLNDSKSKPSEVVVVGYSDPAAAGGQAARILTRQQSEAVCDYLTRTKRVHRTGWVSSRKVTPLGMGASPPPTPEPSGLPPARVEVVVYVAQK